MRTPILSLGFSRETLIEAKNARLVSPEIFEVDCPECNGSGLFPGHPEKDVTDCVPCKGTGRVNA